MGFLPGITSAREDCRSRATILSWGSYSWWKSHRDVISVFFLYRTKYKTQKWEKLQTPEILDKYLSSA